MSQSQACPICENRKTELFLERKDVPASQNLVVKSRLLAKEVSKGQLSLYKCNTCGFVFNGNFDISLVQYGDSYDNTQDRSESFRVHLDSLIQHLIVEKGFTKHKFVEVGCGKGTFLESLVTYPSSNNQGVGFDPAYIGPLSKFGGRLKFEKRFYDQTCVHVPADVVICRHVIEHISKPVQLLKIIRQALNRSPHARLFFETPCLSWILENRAVWDFFYEHCSYYTKDSLSLAFEQAGFQVDRVCHVFKGQYLWLEASLGPNRKGISSPKNVLDLIDSYLVSETQLRARCKEQIRELSKKGKIAIWGAGAKGVTFANLFDPNREFFECVIDLNPKKQGQFLPGTGHSIFGYEGLREKGIQTAILMNPNYFLENKNLLENSSIKTELVNIHE